MPEGKLVELDLYKVLVLVIHRPIS